MADDLYRVLRVSPGAGPEEIRRAYLTLARAHHPDVNRAADAEERFKAINAAYEVLGDPVRRAQYDAARLAEAEARRPRYEPPEGGPFQAPPPPHYPPPVTPEPSSGWFSFRRLWIGVWIALAMVRIAGSLLGSDSQPAATTFRPPTAWVFNPPSATASKPIAPVSMPTLFPLDDLHTFETAMAGSE